MPLIIRGKESGTNLVKILNLIGYFVFLYPLYMSIVWMLGGIVFSLRREKGRLPALKYNPLFSIIVPAHNEEQTIRETILSLKNLNYPKYEVIVVNDGSRDNTAKILDKLVSENSAWLRVIHLEPNSGKSKALNIGILVSRGEFLLTIDSDCIIDKNALKWMAWHLVQYPRVGAVTGNPRVRNRTSLLGKIQVGEYSNIIGLIKRTQRILGKVLTVSGVMAAYRKCALLSCGLFESDTVTEDIDITWKLQKNFWDIRYEPRALSWILVPETLTGLWHQRVRWAQGGVEVLKKHFDIWFKWKYRRLWPLYIEYFVGVLWAHCFLFLVFLWVLFLSVDKFCYLYFIPICPVAIEINNSITSSYNPLFPKWYGAILALACLLEFLTSFVIDYRYEKKYFFKYYFWVVWYPVAYWILSALAVINGTFNVIFNRKGITPIWISPDRGLQSLKSSSKTA
jgi:biofilm PGA synthesis N-glycosyltransferase PgaC